MTKYIFGAGIINMILIANCLLAQTLVVEKHNDAARLWIEAEAGDINKPMNVYDQYDASGGQFIEVTPPME
jgi:hypothetical protein